MFTAIRSGTAGTGKGGAGQTGDTSGEGGRAAGIVRDCSARVAHCKCGNDNQYMFCGSEGDRVIGMNTAQHLVVNQIDGAQLDGTIRRMVFTLH